ncbi:hypothetical protein [Mucilaginibacter rubeus]|uniref:Rad50/SbcC-type AAA domain-containing protein n=1 Tax=Mucilaginibacter rubeus TaxID=2027860 RepID=A0A5C1I3N8_9SPHI|nr:hypothetical protein [Mucilaginibacter rubeus]QEM12374.1 hypothetical protein DEO27_020920 [Mucilaginibacter rubeus]
MINRDQLISTLREYYTTVESISESVLQCERTLEGKVYQNFFFDHSENFLSYDITSYLKQYIAPYYFKNNNALQWNFYLVFLTDQEISEADRITVEENMDYARKFIVRSSEVSDWLSRTYLSSANNTIDGLSGLGDIWKGVLKDQKLDCVFSDNIKVGDGVERIINGDFYVEGGTQKGNLKHKSTEVSVGQLNWLHPIKYREYPKFSEPFKFKKINLIDGANGYGKTSLLEAIEFFVTGENHRLHERESGYEIEAKFLGDQEPRKFKMDTQLFRERDRVWYNGMDKVRGSDLALHFNRFNFYNTDAAFRLTVNKNEKEIEDAFRDIALGDEVNFLKRQIATYKSKLESEQKLRDQSITACDEEIQKAKLLLTELRKTAGNEATLIKALYDKIQQYHIQVNLIGYDLVSLDRLKFSLSILLTELDNILTNLTWLEERTLSEIRDEEQQLIQLVKEIEQFEVADENFTKDINDTNLQQQVIKNSKDLLESLTNYLQGDIHLRLTGHNERLRQQKVIVNQLRIANELYSPVRGFAFPDSNLSIDEYRKILSKQLVEDSAALEQIDVELEKSRKNISQVKALLATIKNDGKNYLELNLNSNVCPMCNSKFTSTSDLQSSILRSMEESVDNEDFSGLLKIKSRLEEAKSATKEQLTLLTTLQEVIEKINLAEASDLPLAMVKTKIDEQLTQLTLEETKLSELESFSALCIKLKIDEQELNALKLKFGQLFPGETLNSSVSERLFDSIQKMMSLNDEKLDEIKTILKGKTAELIAQLRVYDPRFVFEDRDEVKRRLSSLQHYLKELDNLVEIDFDDEKDLSHLQLELRSIVDQLDEIRSDLSIQQKESTLSIKANETIDKKTEERNAAKTENDRINLALNVLENLLTEHNEDNFLQDFLQTNKQEIKETFLSIHTPKEFVDISIKDSTIKLYKKNGKVTDLLRISTGQRSALALSLFLTLNNKLKNGPDILIFDDPVAFTDDMNILSFLDYLREMAIKRNRQIFFATANENLSFLFRKKFEVLDKEFNHITLERVES